MIIDTQYVLLHTRDGARVLQTLSISCGIVNLLYPCGIGIENLCPKFKVLSTARGGHTASTLAHL